MGILFAELNNYFIGYKVDVEKMLALKPIIAGKQLIIDADQNDNIVEDSTVKTSKIDKDENVIMMLNEIKDYLYDDFGHYINRIWEKYVESQPELSNFSKSNGFGWNLQTERVYPDNERYFCLNYGTSTNCIKFCAKTGQITLVNSFPPNCREVLIEFLAEIKFLIHENTIESGMVQDMKDLFGYHVSKHLEFGISGDINYDW